MKTAALPHKAPPDWWREFFDPLVGEVMFVPKGRVSEVEVAQVVERANAKPPLEVLDLACGVGRHSLLFAKRGFAVTGLDYSRPYLQEARRAARKARQRIRYVHGDMRNLRSHFADGTFGLTVSLYNSFGYFRSRRDDFNVVKAVCRVLRPGGAFVINTLNGEGVAKRLKNPVSIGREDIANVFMIDAAQYDPERKQTASRWTIVDARRARVKIWRRSFRQNIYTHAELKQLLTEAGFRVETTWGMLPGGRFDRRTSWSQTMLARKPARSRSG